MGCLVVFVLVVITLDIVQNKVNATDNSNETGLGVLICETETFDTIATGCLSESDLILNFQYLNKTSKIEKVKGKDENTNCYQFTKMNYSFIANRSGKYFSNLKKCEYDLLSVSGTHLYYLSGRSLSEVITQCPEETDLCIVAKSEVHSIPEDDPQETEIHSTCPLSNFTVTSVFDETDKYINLNLTWNKIHEDHKVSVTILQKTQPVFKDDCRREMRVYGHSLLNNSIVKPGMLTIPKVNPGCPYDIYIESEYPEKKKIDCTFAYTVPDCVGDRCDCEKFNPQPKILSLEASSGNTFKVKWDPGVIAVGGSPYVNKEVRFDYRRYIYKNKNKVLLGTEPARILENDAKGHVSEIEMKLFDGENYTLVGTFTNNFSCSNKSEYDFRETEIRACPLSNFIVTSVFNETYKYIDLNLTWNKIQEDHRVSVKILQKQEDAAKVCWHETHVVNHSLLNNSIVKPGMVTNKEVYPGCHYSITMYSENPEKRKINCTFAYTVPDCVGDICDCKDKFKPQPKILSLEPFSGNIFKVKWDPGAIAVGGSPYVNKEVRFDYCKYSKVVLDFDTEPAKILENDAQRHVSEIEMKLFDGENYTLIGTFKNNFSCSNKYRFDFTAPTKNTFSISIIIFAIIAVIIVLLILKHRNIAKYKNKLLNFLVPERRRRSQQSHALFAIPSEQVPMSTNFQYIPAGFQDVVFDEYEFPRNRIIIKEVIGSGAFGLVYSAKAIRIGGIEGYKMVAVKTLGEAENITKDATNDFIAEIEIFKKIGHHPNIVALLGCCTADTPYMMIMEFVPCGDLKNYLLELRAQWLKRKNVGMNGENVGMKRQIFFPDNSNGAYIQPPSPTTSIESSPLPSTSESLSPVPDSPMTPLLAHYAHALEKVLDHTELQNFALQIARGMAHLEKIGVTHRDLAARNILINEHKILKISDFGLSRSGPYINHKAKKLPLRWMAIEAIVEQKYDSKSDVWSFGVVLWEIGTLGAFPYESVLDSFIQQFLQIGRRLERPEICTNELYSLMKQCWAANPNERPTFHDLVDALDVKKKKVYVNFNQLNPTYVFPPSDIENFLGNPVQIVDLDMESD